MSDHTAIIAALVMSIVTGFLSILILILSSRYKHRDTSLIFKIRVFRKAFALVFLLSTINVMAMCVVLLLDNGARMIVTGMIIQFVVCCLVLRDLHGTITVLRALRGKNYWDISESPLRNRNH